MFENSIVKFWITKWQKKKKNCYVQLVFIPTVNNEHHFNKVCVWWGSLSVMVLSYGRDDIWAIRFHLLTLHGRWKASNLVLMKLRHSWVNRDGYYSWSWNLVFTMINTYRESVHSFVKWHDCNEPWRKDNCKLTYNWKNQD